MKYGKYEINVFRNDSINGSNPGVSGYEHKRTPALFLIAIAIVVANIVAFPKLTTTVLVITGVSSAVVLTRFGSSIMAGIQGICHFKRPEDK